MKLSATVRRPDFARAIADAARAADRRRQEAERAGTSTDRQREGDDDE
ncbi:hypothetical protein [Pararhizobium mangrovi]|nr:hypothetical protein [Pararhizobium mangrovi]